METITENEPAISEEDRKNYNPFESLPFGNNIPFVTPDDSLVEKIILQVEYLFSDANILKDKFLLKHVRRNKEGYVSLKLISSLRKVKALSKDWRVVAYSLLKSKKLQMNEEKTKIRRINPLPRESEPEPTRNFHDCTVLLFHNIPGNRTYENVSRLLSEFKSIKSVIKINSKTDSMDLNVKKTLDFYADVATFPFAVVKFDAPSEAVNAILRTCYPTSLVKLVPLVDGILSNGSLPVLSPKFESPNIEASKGIDHNYNNRSKILSSDSKRLGHHEFHLDNSFSTINEDCENDKDRKLIEVQKESSNASEINEKAYPPRIYRGDGPDNNRCTRKKFFNGYAKGPTVIILRQPKGPDGTKGFRVPRVTTSNLNFN